MPADVFAVAALGRISSWKGQEVLVRAIAQPALRDRGAVALIAGSAWRGDEHRARALDELARALGVADRMLMLGFRDDVENVYAAADAVAVPSTEPDPLPNTALEAAAAGRPVVASAHGGLVEILRDGETGLLVPPGDEVALAAALERLAADPGLAARLGGAAAADVRERFAPELLGQRVQALYDELS